MHREYTKNSKKKKNKKQELKKAKHDSPAAKRLAYKNELSLEVHERKGGESRGLRTPLIENSQKEEHEMRQ